MLGTAGVLFASQARADGVDSALGALFGMAAAVLVLGGLALVVGMGTLFFNLSGRHGTASIVLGLLLGLGTLRLGLWTNGSFSDDGGLALLGGALLFLGAGEIAAAVRALRLGRDRSAAPKNL
ncbi:hypothetical protein [Corallococcus coralloides]|nr:hypothetical protein [Corallococcus coralloides]